MPPPIPPTLAAQDIIEVTVEQRLFGQTVLNVFHYRLDDIAIGLYDELCSDMAAKLQAVGELVNLLQLAQTDDVSFENLHLQAISAVRFARISEGGATTGLRAGACKVPELTAVIVQRSLIAHGPLTAEGRGYHRNTFIAGVPDDDMDAGLLVDDYVDGPLTTLATYLCSPLVTDGGNTFYPVIYHRDAAAGPPYTDVETATVKREVRTMRRRVVGRGI